VGSSGSGRDMEDLDLGDDDNSIGNIPNRTTLKPVDILANAERFQDLPKNGVNSSGRPRRAILPVVTSARAMSLFNKVTNRSDATGSDRERAGSADGQGPVVGQGSGRQDDEREDISLIGADVQRSDEIAGKGRSRGGDGSYVRSIAKKFERRGRIVNEGDEDGSTGAASQPQGIFGGYLERVGGKWLTPFHADQQASGATAGRDTSPGGTSDSIELGGKTGEISASRSKSSLLTSQQLAAESTLNASNTKKGKSYETSNSGRAAENRIAANMGVATVEPVHTVLPGKE